MEIKTVQIGECDFNLFFAGSCEGEVYVDISCINNFFGIDKSYGRVKINRFTKGLSNPLKGVSKQIEIKTNGGNQQKTCLSLSYLPEYLKTIKLDTIQEIAYLDYKEQLPEILNQAYITEAEEMKVDDYLKSPEGITKMIVDAVEAGQAHRLTDSISRLVHDQLTSKRLNQSGLEIADDIVDTAFVVAKKKSGENNETSETSETSHSKYEEVSEIAG